METFRPPPRVLAPTEGRNSIQYPPLAPLQDTTHIYFVDNKTSDIENTNSTKDHSDFFTNIIHNADLSPADASTQDILLDSRSRWGAELKTLVKTNAPNVSAFFNSNSFRALLMSDKTDVNNPKFEWFTLTIPEGNYTSSEVIDFMNDAILQNYLLVGRQNGVTPSDIGVKIDTRNFGLGLDPLTGLITPGVYTYKSFHPDVILLPGCGIDFTNSRLNNMLGIRKRLPYEKGFQILYDDLAGGNIPPLLDLSSYPTTTKPVERDKNGLSYHVVLKSNNPNMWETEYRSWSLAYHNNGPIRKVTLLTVPDVTGGLGQLYWSFPDTFKAPITFSNNNSSTSTLPVVGLQNFPITHRAVYNGVAVYSQLVEQMTNATMVFNRFPDNQILIQPPASTVIWLSENVPSVADHGVQPIRNSLPGVQRVTLTDDRRRPCPYIYKSLATVTPKVLSSATIQ